jgi:hypothetical protein
VNTDPGLTGRHIQNTTERRTGYQNACPHPDSSGARIPGYHFAPVAAILPLCAKLFGLHADGRPAVWTAQGRMAWSQADVPLSSVGRLRV